MKIGFTCGAFDLLHAGHILMLKEARTMCDYLVVGVQTDPSVDRPSKNKPIQNFDERIMQVQAIKYVDEVMVYDTEKRLVELLKDLKPHIRIVGADWKGEKFTGHDLPIEVYFNSRDHDWSTNDLRMRVYLSMKEREEV
jgi:glycerol-3-phosphate cytidylyltransferase